MPFLDNPIVVAAIMLVWGLVVRYVPALKEFPNRMIVWCNLLIGVLAKLAMPEPAHAGILGSIGHSLGWMVVPLETFLARGLFETYLKPTLEHLGIEGYPTPVKK